MHGMSEEEWKAFVVAEPRTGKLATTRNAEAFGRRNAVPGELLVRLRPAHVVARAATAD
jgi:hypothetical protein